MKARTMQTDSFVYPYDPAPPIGGSSEIQSGIHWIRLPAPYKGMDHVNVWLLEDGDSWTLVDTGPPDKDTTLAWEQLFDTLLAGRPITRIIATHHHPDHIGLGAWMRKQFASQIWMTPIEYELLEGSLSSAHPQHAELEERFYHMHGLQDIPDWSLPDNISMASTFPLEHTVEDNEYITIGNRQWQVIVTGGHTPEHFVLSCQEDKILIGGDLLLPTISSNVGVYPRLPEANPLECLFTLIDRLKGFPANTLVLPSHETPYLGLSVKLQNLDQRYQPRLKTITQVCTTPHTAYELLPEIFKYKLSGMTLSLAMREMIAYLNYLHGKAIIESSCDADEICRFQKCV